MLLTETAAPVGSTPVGSTADPVWPWVLLASVVVLLAVLAVAALLLYRARGQADKAAADHARTIEEVRRDLQEEQERVGRLRAALAERDRVARAVTDEVLPLVARRVREGASPATLMAEFEEQGLVDPATRPLAESVTRSLWKGHRQRARLLGVVKGCADRARAGVSQLRAEVRERSQPYWESLDATGASERVRDDFMVVEAGLSRLEMLIQRLLTVAEADRIGRNWTQPLRVERVVRAAVGSVPEFARVQVHAPTAPVVVEGRAVNAIIQVLAELVDNATSFSAPSEAVVVHFESTALRLGVHIDDSGLAMEEDQLAEVRRRMDPERPPDITELSANQLGLLVVRRAADPLGIRVDVGPSPRGGTRATVWIPRNGLLRTDEAALAGAGPAPVAAAPATSPVTSTPAGSPVSSAAAPSATASGPAGSGTGAAPAAYDGPEAAPETPAEPTERPRHLPRRRRGATLPENAGPPKTVEPPRDPSATSHRIAQWHAHTRLSPNPPADREDP
ncbi:sensor histidine kinase [Nocardiopsis nanhaiensis]